LKVSTSVFHFVNIAMGIAVSAGGLYWIVKTYYPFTVTSLVQMFAGPGNNSTLLNQQEVFFPLLPLSTGPYPEGISIPVLPISVLLLGILMFGLDRTNPRIAVPLWLMACGAFDILGDDDLIMRLVQNEPSFWVWLQLWLMFGGWILAGRPKFKANWWLVLVIATFVLTVGPSGDGRPFEIALYAYIITSTQPNLWGKTTASSPGPAGNPGLPEQAEKTGVFLS